MRNLNIDYEEYEKLIKPWHIKQLIGEGTFGQVFEIVREEFGYTYSAALKVITIPQNKSEIDDVMSEGMDYGSVRDYYCDIVSEISKECAIMYKFKGNSNIVSYEDHKIIDHEDEIGWDILIRMELLTPITRYYKDNPITERDVIKLGIDICRALEVCKTENVIHRDIKPENIFISKDGNFKLGDFGIARTIEKTTGAMTRTGTMTYMAPEIYKGEAYGFSVDIYSLGLVMYRLLNNNRIPFLPPYPNPITYTDKENANMMRMNGVAFPFPCNSSDSLSKIILKACSFDAKARYKSASDMRKALENLLSDEENTARHYNSENEEQDGYVNVRDNEIEDEEETEILFDAVSDETDYVKYDYDRGDTNETENNQHNPKSFIEVRLYIVFFIIAIMIVTTVVVCISDNPNFSIGSLNKGKQISDVYNEENAYSDIPNTGREFYVIYREGYRDNRIELAEFDMEGDNRMLEWDGKILQSTDDTSVLDNIKFFLDGGEWKEFEQGYERVSNNATEILKSNIEILNTSE